MCWYHNGWGGMNMGWMMLWWIPALLLVVGGMVWFGRLFNQTNQGNQGGAPAEADAVEILKRRYARGEIGQEEYQQKLKDLQG